MLLNTQKKKRSGFTLIELLIVVAILGILVSIGVPALATSRENAINAKRATITAQVANGKTRYLLETAGATTAAFDALTEAQRFTAISGFMTVNGVAPANAAAMLGSALSPAYVLTVGNSATAPSIDVAP